MGRIQIQRLTIPIRGPRGLAGPVRIAHISDLHLRRWDRTTEEAQQLLLDLEYDVLAVTGDIGDHASRWPDTAELAARFFAPLKPRLGSFGVLGNHDSAQLADRGGLGLKFLRDQWIRVGAAGAEFILAGIEQTKDRPGDVERALDGVPADLPVVFLSHFPSTVYTLPAGRVRLMLCGHTHGGQIRLPFLGCVWTHDRIPRRMARGLHRVGGVYTHVSAGLGTSGLLRARVLCPPAIDLLTLEPVAEARNRTLAGVTASKQERVWRNEVVCAAQ